MKNYPCLLLVAFLLSSPAVFAADAPASAPAPAAKSAAKPVETELGEEMDQIAKGYRALRKIAADPAKKDEALQQVAGIRQAAQAAAKLTPYKVSEIPEAERAKMVAGYAAKMREFLQALDRLEATLKAGNHGEAGKLVQELGSIQKAGHSDYKSKSLD